MNARIVRDEGRALRPQEAALMRGQGGVHARLAVKAAKAEELSEAIQRFYSVAMEIDEESAATASGNAR